MKETQEERDAEWLAEVVDGWTTRVRHELPSETAERLRYLPESVTKMAGPFRFKIVPFWKEVLDCLAVGSPIRELAVMKGVQIAFTTAVLENFVLYVIAYVKTQGLMFVTSEQQLADQRMAISVTPMIQQSGIADLIRSNDELSTKKQGKTNKRIEWRGGGFMLPLGANNPSMMASIPFPNLVRDEIDRFPSTTTDGPPLKLTFDRTKTYEDSRKVLDGSTPTNKGDSNIEDRFERGDQRRYYVKCLGCGEHQTLRWRRIDKEGVVSGIVWEMHEGRLVLGSVRYLCKFCGHAHSNEDKFTFLDPDAGAEWRPTAIPVAPHVRSYHLSALYSPPGMQSWEGCVLDWLDCWDVENETPKDLEKLKVFYNNILGETFEVRGFNLSFSTVSQHRRHEYKRGTVPNSFAEKHGGSRVVLLTAAVDVQEKALHVAIVGWSRGARAWLIDYVVLGGAEAGGDTKDLENPATWGALSEMLENQSWLSDDGIEYRLAIVLVDSGDGSDGGSDTVYQYCAQYEGNPIYPIKGRDATQTRSSALFDPMKKNTGVLSFMITVDAYKDRWMGNLRRYWDPAVQPLQSEWHFSAPGDMSDREMKELASERKVLEKKNGKRVWRYKKTSRANELWDLLMYNSAALEIVIWDWCVNQQKMDRPNHLAYWEASLEGLAAE